jgi:hypothetical protein
MKESIRVLLYSVFVCLVWLLVVFAVTKKLRRADEQEQYMRKAMACQPHDLIRKHDQIVRCTPNRNCVIPDGQFVIDLSSSGPTIARCYGVSLDMCEPPQPFELSALSRVKGELNFRVVDEDPLTNFWHPTWNEKP